MKCSKCGYLGFETGSRCRNCGYGFSLSSDYDLTQLPDLPDLSIQRDDDRHDLDDFALVDAGAAPRLPAPDSGPLSVAAVMTAPHTAARHSPLAMPLFAPGIDDD